VNQSTQAPAITDQLRDTESGLMGRIIFWFSIAFALFHVWANTFATLPELTLAAIHFAGFGLLAALTLPVVV